MIYEWIPWEQPILNANNDYGIVSASSYNASSNTAPFHISDGLYDGGSCSWESQQKAIPAWVMWKFPVTLKITKLKLLNKYTGVGNCTKDLVIYTSEDMTYPIAEGQFEQESFAPLRLSVALINWASPWMS